MDQQQPLPGCPPLAISDPATALAAEPIAPGEVGFGQGAPSADTTRNPRPSPRGTAAYQRRRAVKACQVCRARRTKCDNLKPSCSFCLKTGAKCIQSPADLSSFDPASLKILERLDELEELLKSPTRHVPSKDAWTPGSRDAAPSPRQVNSVPGAVLGTDKGMVLPPHVETVMAWPILQPVVAAALTQAWADSTPRSAAASHGSLGTGLGGLEDEPRRVRELLDSFFSHVHVKNPIFDETSTRSLVQSVVLNGIDWTAESCLALLILALGAVATPLGPSHSTMSGSAAYTEAQSYFHAAQKRLGVVTTSDHTIAPQCLFLAGVYLMCVFQPREAWRCFLQALAGCQHFAFLSPGSQREYHNALAEDRHHHTTADRFQQAIYWSAWKSEREGRSLFPHLQDFSTDDHNSGTATTSYPSFFPTPPGPRADTHMHFAHPGTNRAGVMTVGMMVTPESLQHERERTSWYFYLSEISLRRLCARIGAELLELREKHASSQAGFLAAVAANIPSYEEQTLDWIRSLPPCLSFDAAPEKDDICRFVLRGQALNIYEMIYWPFLSTILGGDGVSAHGYLNGNDQAGLHRQLAQKGLDYHLYRLVVNKPGYQHRHHGTLYMMHSCYRSSLILVAAAVGCAPRGEDGGDEPRFSLSVPPGWHQSVGEVLSLLAIWSTETCEFDQVRSVLEAGLGYTLATVSRPMGQ